jgi:ferredoxin
MRVMVDETRCIGCGLCIVLCDKVFAETGYRNLAQAKVEVVPPEAEKACRQAIRSCPVHAMLVMK